MVFYFTTSEGFTLYMGRDKFENEELIKWGFDEDIWFHVDDLSSAHVYLRLPIGASKLDDITPAALAECCQLVKENSIEGCKKDRVSVCYTKWKNLKKEARMEVGAVSFHRPANVRHVMVEKDKSVVKALNKTRVEASPDFAAERRAREQIYKKQRKEAAREMKKAELEARKKAEEERRLREYDGVFTEEAMVTNAEMAASEDTSAAVEFEEDFM